MRPRRRHGPTRTPTRETVLPARTGCGANAQPRFAYTREAHGRQGLRDLRGDPRRSVLLACGEKQVDRRDLALGHFLSHAFEVLTHFDARVFRTVASLLRRPGQLTVDYARGRRKPYLGPVQTFFLINALFFVVSGATHAPMANPPLERCLQRLSILDVVDLSSVARTLVAHRSGPPLLMVLLFTPFVCLLYYRSRRFVMEHLVFSFFFYCAFLVWICLVLLPTRLNPEWRDSAWVQLSLVIPALGYLYAALRRVYAEGPFLAAAKAAALYVGLALARDAYRLILFLATIATV